MTCRDEILDAVEAVLTRSGATTFTVADVLAEMRRRRTQYADTTIRTHVTGVMCSNAPTHHLVTHPDFERMGRGIYQLFDNPRWREERL